MHGLLKLFVALVLFVIILFLWAYFSIDDTPLDNSLENIDDTKFPISDYLYLNPTNESQINNLKNNDEPQINNQKTNTQPNKQELENYTISGLEEDEEELQDNNKIKVNNVSNSVKRLFDDAFNVNHLDAINEDEIDEINKTRLNILSTRTGKISVLNKEKDNAKLGIEYGADRFSNLNIQDKASNEHKLYRTISAMKMIPAILITNISSDIGGKIIAQVEEDIYAEMGKAVLIPKGSKVLGNYTSNNKIGEYRLNVFWTRILTPQGVNIMLTDAYGADLAGAMGLIGDLDSKYWQRYGIPLALSTISNGLIITLNNVTSKYSNNANSANAYMNAELMQNMQGDISQIMAQIIREQVKIQPTIRIEKGSRIFITSNKDIFFPIPKQNEILARFFDEVKTIEEETNEGF